MNVTKITIGRLFNLGSYEHVRYEVSVEVQENESASAALIGLERIMEALKPISQSSVHSKGQLERESDHLAELDKQLDNLTEEEFRQRHGFFEGTPREYCVRRLKSHLENLSRFQAITQRAEKARAFLDDLGGAAQWKDSKLDWEDRFE